MACIAWAPVRSQTGERLAVRPAVVADGFIYVSGISGAEPGTSEPQNLRTSEPSEDVAVQTRRVLDRLMLVLGEAGSSLGHVVNVTVQLRRAEESAAVDAVYREFFPEEPPARTVVVTSLADGARVHMSAVAVPVGTVREVIRPASWPAPSQPYSHAVRAGGLVFLSGLVGRRPSNNQMVPGLFDKQTTMILDNADTLLEAAKLTKRDVVASRVFLGDDIAFESVNEEYGRYFATEPPARAMGVTAFADTDALVQISMVAAIGGKQTIGPLVSPTLPVSAGVRAGNRIFLSGVLGNTGANRGDLAAQTREAFTRVERTLQSAGASLDDVVDSTIYLPDPWQAPRLAVVLRDLFPHRAPARTIVSARLLPRDAQLELLVTAVK
jgi:2-iminobutanoate/2-iminopropanoate deaminase